MHLAVYITLILALACCGKKAAKVIVPPLPKVDISEVPAPPTPTVIVEKGSNLQTIATTAYHHEDFSGFLGQLNGITKPERLLAGATLKTPSLPVAFRDAGLDEQYQPSINALAKAWADFAKILPDYLSARDASGAKDGETFVVPANIKVVLLKCADAIDASIDILQHPKNGHVAPLKTISQFAGSSGYLRQFAAGYVGSRDYDTFMAEKGFGLGFTYALIWTQSGHK